MQQTEDKKMYCNVLPNNAIIGMENFMMTAPEEVFSEQLIIQGLWLLDLQDWIHETNICSRSQQIRLNVNNTHSLQEVRNNN